MFQTIKKYLSNSGTNRTTLRDIPKAEYRDDTKIESESEFTIFKEQIKTNNDLLSAVDHLYNDNIVIVELDKPLQMNKTHCLTKLNNISEDINGDIAFISETTIIVIPEQLELHKG